MIIHVRVRFEFPEVLAARLASRSLNLSVLCLVVDQALVFLLLREEGGLFAIPSTHRPRFEAIGPVFLPSAKSIGRSALYLVGQHLCWSIGHFWWPNPVHLLYADILCQLVQLASIINPLHTRVWRDLLFAWLLLEALGFEPL